MSPADARFHQREGVLSEEPCLWRRLWCPVLWPERGIEVLGRDPYRRAPPARPLVEFANVKKSGTLGFRIW